MFFRFISVTEKDIKILDRQADLSQNACVLIIFSKSFDDQNRRYGQKTILQVPANLQVSHESSQVVLASLQTPTCKLASGTCKIACITLKFSKTIYCVISFCVKFYFQH